MILAVPLVERRIVGDQVAHARVAGRLGDGARDIEGLVGAAAGEAGELVEGLGAGESRAK
jgi:hypothetical protein